MSELVKTEIIDVCPSPYGYAVFMRADSKVFVIYMDRARGGSLQSALQGYKAERPLTHEFFAQMLDGFDCKVKNVVVYNENEGTFFTRINVEMENELGKKIIELDGRPSDTFPIALRTSAPIFTERALLDSLEDMGEALKKLKGE